VSSTRCKSKTVRGDSLAAALAILKALRLDFDEVAKPAGTADVAK
jgi:hypothetical protein